MEMRNDPRHRSIDRFCGSERDRTLPYVVIPLLPVERDPITLIFYRLSVVVLRVNLFLIGAYLRPVDYTIFTVVRMYTFLVVSPTFRSYSFFFFLE